MMQISREFLDWSPTGRSSMPSVARSITSPVFSAFKYRLWGIFQRHSGWQSTFKVESTFSLILVFVAMVTYVVTWAIFGDVKHIAFFFFHDLAFLPLHVLLVTFAIERFLQWRERQSMRNRAYMAIGMFFSEVGTELLCHLVVCDKLMQKHREDFQIEPNWSCNRISQLKKHAKGMEHDLCLDDRNLEWLMRFLVQQRHFLLTLIGNGNLIERESFANLLWSLMHVEMELKAFIDQRIQPKVETIEGNQQFTQCLRSAYLLLISHWLSYVRHLKTECPHLYTLAVQLNPFNQIEPFPVERTPSSTSRGVGPSRPSTPSFHRTPAVSVHKNDRPLHIAVDVVAEDEDTILRRSPGTGPEGASVDSSVVPSSDES